MRRCDTEDWMPAVVPGCVYLDLLREGAIADPFYRDHEMEAIDVAAHDYEYVRPFTVTAKLLQHDAIRLVCRGLDTLAEIYVNSRLAAA